MYFQQITDSRLSQYAYLIGCQRTGEALIIDPERDIDRYIEAAEQEGLTISSVMETHIHADFVSGAREFAERHDVRLLLSQEGGDEWQVEWARSGDYNVQLLRGGDEFTVGNVHFEVLHTPGHTPEHLSVLVTDRGGDASEPMGIATGDFVFVGDLGRPDLLESAAGEQGAMKPSAKRLFKSAQQFLELPDHLQVWPGHGAGSACGKSMGAVPQSTVGYERITNQSLEDARTSEDQFVRSILSDQTDPPLYFARMKKVNKSGPVVLGEIARPNRLTPADLEAATDDAILLDTRTDRSEFMKGHTQGAQFAPFDKSFPTVVGSLVEDPETPIILLIGEADAEEAARNLYRIGYDNLLGYLPPDEVKTHSSIEVVDFERADKLVDEGMQVVDVRFRSEYDEGHMRGAVVAPYTRLPEYLDEIPKDVPLVVHCAGGVRSAPASSFFSRMGRKVFYVDDTFSDWAESNPDHVVESDSHAF